MHNIIGTKEKLQNEQENLGEKSRQNRKKPCGGISENKLQDLTTNKTICKLTFNWASAECVAGVGLLAVESPQCVWPTGPDGVSILAAAKVYFTRTRIIR